MAVKNWFSDFIDSYCIEGEGKEAVFNMNTLFLLAERNYIPEDKIAAWKDKFKAENANLGLIKMQVSNMLRSRAIKRHGLNDPAGDFEAVPVGDSFVAGKNRVENPDGTKIVKNKENAPESA